MADVEKRAILAIDEPISLSERMVAHLDANDKTPLTDGFVMLYEGLGRRKEEIIGRVDVQIKGRTIRHKLAPSSFPMTRAELQAILRHGTVVLFVSHVRPDGSYLGRPGYAVLSPFTVQSFLDDMKKSARSFSVPLRDLPDNLSELESIIAIAIRTKKQSVFAGATDLAQTGLKLLERSVSFTISSAQNLNFSAPVVVSHETGDYVIEVETPEGLMVPLPGHFEIRPASYSYRPLEAKVRSGAVEVADARIRQVDATQFEIEIVEGLTLTNRVVDGSISSGAISLTLPSNLRERVLAIDLFLEMAGGSPLYIDDRELAFDFNGEGDLDHLRHIRAQLAKLMALFDLLHVDSSLIEMDEVSAEQETDLKYLHSSLFEGMKLKAESAPSKNALVYVQVGSWRLHLLLLNDSDEGNVPLDVFAPENRRRFSLYSTDEAAQPLEVEATVYDTLDRENLPRILNLNLPAIVPAYEQIADTPNMGWLANQSVLRLIHAADDCARRRREFLDAALALNDWLAVVDGPTVPGRLNRLQIELRLRGDLDSEQRTEIRALRRDIVRGGSESAALAEIGCAILLDEREEVADGVARLSAEQRQNLESYPIWSLYQNRPATLLTPSL